MVKINSFSVHLCFLGLAFLISACGKENHNHRPLISAEAEQLASRNHLNGTWKFTRFGTTLKDGSMALLPRIIDDPLKELTWTVTSTGLKTSLGIIKFTQLGPNHAPLCSVSLEYDMRYCCETMRVAYLADQPRATGENPSGCITSTFNMTYTAFITRLKTEIGPDFHFTYRPNFVELQGPYTDSKNFIELRPL